MYEIYCKLRDEKGVKDADEYRNTHGMSMDAFSEKSGISKAYISLLEKK